MRLLFIPSLLALGLLISAFSHATPAMPSYSMLPHELRVIANRLASKTISEVAVIAMKLQIECQQRNNADVCTGVKNILAVLEARIAGLPSSDKNASLAFVQGLIDGVKDANMRSIPSLNQD